MKKRNANIMFNQNGNGSDTTRITLPVTWIKEMGFTSKDRIANISFENDKIIIEKGEIKMFKVICFNDVYNKEMLKKYGSNNYRYYADSNATTNFNEQDFATKKEAMAFAEKSYKEDNEKYSISGNNIYLTRYDVLDYSKDEDSPENIWSFGLTLEEFDKIYNK